MEEPPLREEEEEEEEDEEDVEEEDGERDEAGPEGALGKSPFRLTAKDVYDISFVVGRELMALGSDPRVTQLQFKIVRVLEMLEALVSEGSLAAEALRMERDSLRKEVEGLRREGRPAGGEVSVRGRCGEGPRAGSGLFPPREDPGGRREKDALVTRAGNAGRNKEEKTIIKKL
uniref:RILP-like protein 2 n=1 Tax=Propithecus coquereli TaxID=379532 RepID=A0A2K6GJB5_PROCO